jgi:hypothetical protein
MVKQGANRDSIQNVIKKFIGRQQDTFAKFKQPFPQIIQDLIT